MINVGRRPEVCVDRYGHAIDIGWELLQAADFEKFHELKKFRFKVLLKKHGLGFLFGVLASLVAALIVYFIKIPTS